MAEKKEKAEKEEKRGVAPWRPFGELEPWSSLFDEGSFSGRFPRLLDELFRGGLREWPKLGRAGAFLPAIDISDDAQAYTITVELPGGKKDDVTLEVHDEMLTIRGEKRSEREEKKEHRRYVERSYGSFSRSFRLPSDADAEHIDASFKDGVLTIRVPKTEVAKPRTIAVK
jgi:HSP20 family protein